MQFGIKVLGAPCSTPGCWWDVKTFPSTHETAPLFFYKHVILATHPLTVCSANSGQEDAKLFLLLTSNKCISVAYIPGNNNHI